MELEEAGSVRHDLTEMATLARKTNKMDELVEATKASFELMEHAAKLQTALFETRAMPKDDIRPELRECMKKTCGLMSRVLKKHFSETGVYTAAGDDMTIFTKLLNEFMDIPKMSRDTVHESRVKEGVQSLLEMGQSACNMAAATARLKRTGDVERIEAKELLECADGIDDFRQKSTTCQAQGLWTRIWILQINESAQRVLAEGMQQVVSEAGPLLEEAQARMQEATENLNMFAGGGKVDDNTKIAAVWHEGWSSFKAKPGASAKDTYMKFFETTLHIADVSQIEKVTVAAQKARGLLYCSPPGTTLCQCG
eukprot:11209886-Lingulodinium_polyedra.AAC.1